MSSHLGLDSSPEYAIVDDPGNAMNAPGHAVFWLREHCRGLINPNLAPREHDLGRDETNVFRGCRFCRLLRRLCHS